MIVKIYLILVMNLDQESLHRIDKDTSGLVVVAKIMLVMKNYLINLVNTIK